MSHAQFTSSLPALLSPSAVRWQSARHALLMCRELVRTDVPLRIPRSGGATRGKRSAGCHCEPSQRRACVRRGNTGLARSEPMPGSRAVNGHGDVVHPLSAHSQHPCPGDLAHADLPTGAFSFYHHVRGCGVFFDAAYLRPTAAGFPPESTPVASFPALGSTSPSPSPAPLVDDPCPTRRRPACRYAHDVGSRTGLDVPLRLFLISR
jgi:hypothetical protein